MRLGGRKPMHSKAFTIVELLIVIVVIAIIATISVVAYQGIQTRAYNTAVQSDIANVAKKLELFKAELGYYPTSGAQMTTLGLSVTKSAYGSGYLNNQYNFVFCRVANPAPSEYSLVAANKAGTIYVYKSSTKAFTTIPSWPSNNVNATCQSTGINSTTIYDFDALFSAGNWDSYVSG